jgi:hydroxymethylbilane synthase
MSPDVMLPAVAQGAIGIEIREGDDSTARILAPLNDVPTAVCVAAERAYLARLEGSCRTPIAGFAELSDGRLHLRGEILSTDGARTIGSDRSASARAAVDLGQQIAADVLERAGPDFFATA